MTPAVRPVNETLRVLIRGHMRGMLSVTVALLLAGVFSFPSFTLAPDKLQQTWVRYWSKVVQRKVTSPLADLSKHYPPESNQAKRNFRITVPLIAYLTRTGVPGAFIFNLGASLIFLYTTWWLARSVTADGVVPFFVVLGFAATYPGTSGLKDIFGWFDATAYACLALALLVRNPVGIATAIFVGLFTDERVLLMAPAVVYYHLIGATKSDSPSTGKLWKSGQVWAVIAAMGAYAVIRLGLAHGLDYGTPTQGIGLKEWTFNLSSRLFLSLWAGLEGGWILLAGGVTLLARRGDGRLAICLAGTILAAALICHGVLDTTRSLGYLFPLTFIVLKLLATNPQVSTRAIRYLVIAAASVSLVAPNYFLWHYVEYERSLPHRLLSGESLHLLLFDQIFR